MIRRWVHSSRGGFGAVRRLQSTIVAGVVLLLVAALLIGTPAAAEGPRRVALVIGNARYEHVPALANPANDARLIADTLRDLGFELTGGGAQIDLDRGGLERVIRDFSYRLSPGSVGFFYYSGHGIQLRGLNFLVPVSANPTSARDADFELVDTNLLLRQMEDSGASLNVVILDACRNNPFAGRGLKDLGAGLAQMQAPRGTIIAYATQPGGVAADGSGSDSPYTEALARLMKRPGVGILEMFNQVAVTVDQATNRTQQPWTALSPITQDFFLAGKNVDIALGSALPGPTPDVPRTGASATAPGAGGVDREVVFWQSVQNSRNPEEFEAYIRRFPDGLFVDVARARIAELNARARIAELKQPTTAEPGRGQSPPLASPENQQQALAKVPAVTFPVANFSKVQITESQRELAGMGLFGGATDGNLGPRTREAIRAFQLSVNSPADGELSETLLAQLHGPSPPQQARARALVILAEEAVHAADASGAMRLYAASVVLDPANSGGTLLALGDLQKSAGNIDDARRSFSRAAQMSGTIGEAGQRRLAGLPQPVKIVPVPANSPTTPKVSPTPQLASPASAPTTAHQATASEPNGAGSIWSVTAIGGREGGGSGFNNLTTTQTDTSKEAAEEKAIQYCKKYAPFGWANSCRISSEAELATPSPPVTRHEATQSEQNNSNRIWAVTVVSGSAGKTGNGNTTTQTDTSKTVAEEKAMQWCKEHAAFGMANSCRVSSEREQDAEQ
jgi:peptidoglycan hydrolase-like protein with peptidoglycan-binding domain